MPRMALLGASSRFFCNREASGEMLLCQGRLQTTPGHAGKIGQHIASQMLFAAIQSACFHRHMIYIEETGQHMTGISVSLRVAPVL
jgi:hypothetical protein